MLNRKTAASSEASSRQRHIKAKTAPVRRRFVITSSARRNAAKAADANGKSKTHDISAAAGKLPAASHANAAAPAPTQSTVDLTETIKTLLHLAQEHGYEIGRAS